MTRVGGGPGRPPGAHRDRRAPRSPTDRGSLQTGHPVHVPADPGVCAPDVGRTVHLMRAGANLRSAGAPDARARSAPAAPRVVAAPRKRWYPAATTAQSIFARANSSRSGTSNEGGAISRDLRVNQMIRVPQVRVIVEEGNQRGVMPTHEALRLAQERGFDLVEVAPMAAPPVVRFLDFGQYKYELTKREKEAKRKQRSVTFKEVRLKPKIGVGDFDTKVRRAIEFLEDGDRVKVAVQFRGRELTHPEIGRNLLIRFSEQIKDHGVVERAPMLEGKSMHITVASTHKPKTQEGPAAPGRGDGAEPDAAPAAPTSAPTSQPAAAAPAAPRPAPVAAPAARPAPAPAAAAAPAPARRSTAGNGQSEPAPAAAPAAPAPARAATRTTARPARATEPA